MFEFAQTLRSQLKNISLLMVVGLSYRKHESPGGYAQPREFNFSKGKGAEAFALRAVGKWSKNLLDYTATGQKLKEMHAANVSDTLKKASELKDPKEAEEIFEKALATPQQRFVLLYEAGFEGPLAPQAFTEYMRLFKEFFPNTFEKMYGSKTPEEVTAEFQKRDTKKVSSPV